MGESPGVAACATLAAPRPWAIGTATTTAPGQPAPVLFDAFIPLVFLCARRDTKLPLLLDGEHNFA